MKKALAIGALPVVFLVVTAFQSSNSVPAQLAAIQAQLDSMETQLTALAAKEPRQFYLTKTGHNGGEALSACAPGYHMASLWEIKDPSNLRYNTQLGETQEDSGFGPPVGLLGWVRTGSSGASSVNAGIANCFAWTNASMSENGSMVGLVSNWVLAITTNTVPWHTSVTSCAFDVPVWCVQD